MLGCLQGQATDGRKRSIGVRGWNVNKCSGLDLLARGTETIAISGPATIKPRRRASVT